MNTDYDDARYRALLKAWISEFHGQIKPVSSAEFEYRIESYYRQEDLYREKVRFIFHLLRGLGVRPHAGLDVGSSAGGLSVALAEAGLAMDGIEPSPQGVEASRVRARRLGLQNVEFKEGVGEQLPFLGSHFDLVVSLAVLEHVQDVRRVVNETYRILKPGGVAYFEVPNNFFPFEAHYKLPWLPMMPKPLARHYVAAYGYNPDFLDSLHYMSRGIAFKHFRAAGFIGIRDVYGNYLAGKAAGAPWLLTHPARYGHVPKLGWLVKSVCNFPLLRTFLNRAVYLLAVKPE